MVRTGADLGRAIREARNTASLTQEQLAKSVGIDRIWFEWKTESVFTCSIAVFACYAILAPRFTLKCQEKPMPNQRTQNIWLRGVHVGEISAKRRDQISFQYSPEILDVFSMNTPVLSCSLPMTPRKVNAQPFFAGLLPEGEALRFLAQQAECLTTDTFQLLNHFGQDVAGAVIVGESPLRIHRLKKLETSTVLLWNVSIERELTVTGTKGFIRKTLVRH